MITVITVITVVAVASGLRAQRPRGPIGRGKLLKPASVQVRSLSGAPVIEASSASLLALSSRLSLLRELLVLGPIRRE